MSVADWNTKSKKDLREWLSATLKSGNLTITFTKTDGTDRVMKCTLREDAVVPYEQKTERKKPVNEDNLSVWDIERGAWRSFKLDSIKQIQLFIG